MYEGFPVFAQVDAEGNVRGAIQMMVNDEIGEGYVDANGWTYRIAPEGVAMHDLTTRYVYAGGFHDLGAPPGPHYRRDPATLSWVFDAGPAIAEQSQLVTFIRDQKRETPVTLADGWRVDADRDSVLMLQERLEQWGVGTATMTEDGRQLWKGADNDVRYFTQAEFAALVAEVRQLRAARADANFAYAEQLRAQLPLPADHPALRGEGWPHD